MFREVHNVSDDVMRIATRSVRIHFTSSFVLFFSLFEMKMKEISLITQLFVNFIISHVVGKHEKVGYVGNLTDFIYF